MLLAFTRLSAKYTAHGHAETHTHTHTHTHTLILLTACTHVHPYRGITFWNVCITPITPCTIVY